jgi:predicted dehydrogenase
MLLRIATIGTWGHLGQAIAEIATLPEARLVAHARAMADDDISYLRSLTNDPAITWFDDYFAMLHEVRPDVVILSTRIDRINPIAVDVAHAGCHLICEKPLAIEHAALRRLWEATQASKVQCIALLGNGRHPVMRAAQGLIAAGKVGDVVLINTRKSYKWGERPQWFGYRESYGGSIPWVAIHALEMIHLLGNQEFISVAAMQSNRVHSDRPGCEDNGAIILGLSGGGHASISFDMLRPKAADTHGDDFVRIVGSTGVIEASLDRRWCRFVSDESEEVEIPLPSTGEFYAPFLRGIEKADGNPMIEMRRAFMLTHVALLARDAADEKVIKSIPPFESSQSL